MGRKGWGRNGKFFVTILAPKFVVGLVVAGKVGVGLTGIPMYVMLHITIQDEVDTQHVLNKIKI